MKECLLHFVDTLILKKPTNKQQKKPLCRHLAIPQNIIYWLHEEILIKSLF